MRFGTTCTDYGTLPDARTDPRIHNYCFIAIQSEKLVKKVKQPNMIWICAESVQQMFTIIRLLSVCLSSINAPAPTPNNIKEVHALHRYRPEAFKPENDWERFWDNPPRPKTASGGITTAVSVDALHMAVKKEEKENKKLKKSKSNPALEASPLTVRSVPAADTASLSSHTSYTSSVSRQSARVPIREMLVGEAARPQRTFELHKHPELGYSVINVQKTRKYEKLPDSGKSTPASRHRSRPSSVLNGNYVNRPTYVEKEESDVVHIPVTYSPSYGSPQSILKRNSSYSIPPDAVSRHSVSSVNEDASGYNTPTRRMAPPSPLTMLRRGSDVAPRRMSLAPVQRSESIQSRESIRSRFTNTAVQTEHEEETIPLIDSTVLSNGHHHHHRSPSPPTPTEEDYSQKHKVPTETTLPVPHLASTQNASSCGFTSDDYRSLSSDSDTENEKPTMDEPNLVVAHENTRVYTMDMHVDRF